MYFLCFFLKKAYYSIKPTLFLCLGIFNMNLLLAGDSLRFPKKNPDHDARMTWMMYPRKVLVSWKPTSDYVVVIHQPILKNMARFVKLDH